MKTLRQMAELNKLVAHYKRQASYIRDSTLAQEQRNKRLVQLQRLVWDCALRMGLGQ